jgi:hypothetical protein
VYSGDEGSGAGVSARLTLTLGTKPVHSLLLSGASTRGSSHKPLAFEEVVVTVPFPRTVRTASFHVTTGNCLYDEATKVSTHTLEARRGIM